VFYLQFTLIGIAGSLPSGMIYAKLIAEWFDTRRGLWIGIAGGVGNGIGATFFPLLAGVLLPVIGWRAAFGVIALIILIVGLPIQWLLLREAPAARAALSDSDTESAAFEGLEMRAALHTPTFWLLVTALPIGGGCLIGLFSMIVPVVTARGFSLDVATMVIAVFALVCTLWEPSVGFILDHSKRPRILAPLYWIGAGGVVMLLDARGSALLAASAVMLAIGLGAESSALSFLLSRYFGRRALGAISGVAFGVMLGAGALTMVLLNAAYDAGLGYRVAVLCLIPVLIWNGAALLFLGPYPFNAASVDT
jgi:MFS family permease